MTVTVERNPEMTCVCFHPAAALAFFFPNGHHRWYLSSSRFSLASLAADGQMDRSSRVLCRGVFVFFVLRFLGAANLSLCRNVVVVVVDWGRLVSGWSVDGKQMVCSSLYCLDDWIHPSITSITTPTSRLLFGH